MQWPTWHTFKVLWHILSITSIVIHSQYYIQYCDTFRVLWFTVLHSIQGINTHLQHCFVSMKWNTHLRSSLNIRRDYLGTESKTHKQFPNYFDQTICIVIVSLQWIHIYNHWSIYSYLLNIIQGLFYTDALFVSISLLRDLRYIRYAPFYCTAQSKQRFLEILKHDI